MGSLSLCTGLCGRVAQLVEHRTFNPVVAGSIPAPFTSHFNTFPALLPVIAEAGPIEWRAILD